MEKEQDQRDTHKNTHRACKQISSDRITYVFLTFSKMPKNQCQYALTRLQLPRHWHQSFRTRSIVKSGSLDVNLRKVIVFEKCLKNVSTHSMILWSIIISLSCCYSHLNCIGTKVSFSWRNPLELAKRGREAITN